MDNLQQRHEMVLEKTHPTGAEEWYCPICGRRFLMQWPPEYKKIVIVPGDQYAVHSGGKGGLHISSLRAAPEKGDNIFKEDLTPWLEALDEIDFDNLDDRAA